MSLRIRKSFGALVTGLGLLWSVSAQAGIVSGTDFIPDCSQGGCDWSVQVDGVSVGEGTYNIDPNTGDISLSGPVSFNLSDGTSAGINNLNGNADPILGFNVSAGTGALGKTFAFNFSLPIALSGPINANSSVSYSLTSLTSAGAQISPLFGKVVVAQEVDTSIGGLAPLNKGVDVGDTFFFVGGPATNNSPVYTASNAFVGNIAYDLMSVTVAFSLSANSNVGASGFVQQTPVPVPAAVLLFGSGLLGLIGVARRRS
jgi:hypothetical protein